MKINIRHLVLKLFNIQPPPDPPCFAQTRMLEIFGKNMGKKLHYSIGPLPQVLPCDLVPQPWIFYEARSMITIDALFLDYKSIVLP